MQVFVWQRCFCGEGRQASRQAGRKEGRRNSVGKTIQERQQKVWERVRTVVGKTSLKRPNGRPPPCWWWKKVGSDAQRSPPPLSWILLHPWNQGLGCFFYYQDWIWLYHQINISWNLLKIAWFQPKFWQPGLQWIQGHNPNSDLAAVPHSVLPKYGFIHTRFSVFSNACATVEEAAADPLSGLFCWFLSQLSQGLVTANLSKEAGEPVLQPWGHRQEDSYAPHRPVGPNIHRSCARRLPLLRWTPSVFHRSQQRSSLCSAAQLIRHVTFTPSRHSFRHVYGEAGTCEILSSR